MEHAGNIILWSSTRQPFITQSTAEAELLAYSEGYQVAESTAALLELLGWKVSRQLMGFVVRYRAVEDQAPEVEGGEASGGHPGLGGQVDCPSPSRHRVGRGRTDQEPAGASSWKIYGAAVRWWPPWRG